MARSERQGALETSGARCNRSSAAMPKSVPRQGPASKRLVSEGAPKSVAKVIAVNRPIHDAHLTALDKTDRFGRTTFVPVRHLTRERS